ncbi:hypothetical protein [Marinicellulosiphila megalodicopiae]|uniref:hypothetical protein n=1 Tax=Marinicellulosiphila megalodicopiae TaxID=2724896 RepID=UPI003BB213DF
MKIGSIICLALFVIAVLIALVQVWFQPMDVAVFIRVMISFVALFLITIAIVLVRREYLEDDQLKKDHYIG